MPENARRMHQTGTADEHFQHIYFIYCQNNLALFLLRGRRMSILLSEDEQLIVDRYLEKYKITNKSRWLRETILMFIHKNMEEDYPTLFGEHDMRR